jgi:non-ribosomal peptide synthetase component F
MREWLELSERDRLLTVTTISFDIAGLEIWLPLLTGAETVVASRESAVDGNALRELLERHDITFMQATPVTWRILFEAGWLGKPDLQAVCGGEAMPPEVAARLVPAVKRVWNLYGPTETTIWSTGYKIADGRQPILIGRPLANTQCYILDPQRQPVPV